MDVLQDDRARGTISSQESATTRSDDVFLQHDGRQGHARRGHRGRQRSDVSARPSGARRRRSSGTRVLRDIPLDEVFELLDLDELYRLQWGGRGSGPEYEQTVREEFEPDARAPDGRGQSGRLAQAAGRLRLLPRAVARQRPHRLRSGGRTRATAVAARDRALPFPAPGRTRAALPRRLLPLRGSGDVDVVAVPGRDGRRRGDAPVRRAPGRGRVQRGVSSRTASPSRPRRRSRSGCTARIRHELGDPGRSRQALLVGLRRLSRPRGPRARCSSCCRPSDALGMELTSAFQLVPEQSTAAIIVHHPEAKYYAVRGSGGRETPRSASRQSRSRAVPSIDRRMTRARSLDSLDPDRVVVFDGAMGTMLYAQGRLHQPVLRRAEPPRAGPRARGAPRVREGRRRGPRDEQLRREPREARAVRPRDAGARDQPRAPRSSPARQPAGAPCLVAGAVGPLGVRIEPYGPTSTRRSARPSFASRWRALKDGRRRPASSSRRSATSHEIEQAIAAARATSTRRCRSSRR